MTTDARRSAVELVVLLTSAGGLDALSIVLRDLPTELPAAEVVEQHLAGLSSVLPTILGRQTPHRVSWAQDGQAVVPGEVVVGPPGIHLELTPDCRCRLRETEALGERRFDVLLASVARSWGARSADLVLPIHEIGRVLAEIVAGAPLPKPRPREKGWAATPLGRLAQCPAERNGENAIAAGWESMDTGDLTAARQSYPAVAAPRREHRSHPRRNGRPAHRRTAAETQGSVRGIWRYRGNGGRGATQGRGVIAPRATGSPSGRGSGRALGALMSSRGPLPD